MKKLFLATVLALSLSAAWGQGGAVVRVEQLGADYTVSTIRFHVYWDTPPQAPRHLDSVWLFIDY
ncbi:MAG: hypothetical protein LBF19_00385, partial [Prevotellaceae bacterium]|nr:hypothetical protein [Prevotellaceae bacterium]